MRIRGFTLVEMVVVIVLVGILAGAAATLVGDVMGGYTDLSRRAALQSAGRLALERIARELRLALPNSVGVGAADRSLWFIGTRDAGAYQASPGRYASGAVKSPLPFAANSSDRFDLVSGTAVQVSAGDWAVVFHSGATDIYSGTDRRKQVASVAQKDSDGDGVADVAVIRLTAPTSFAAQSPGRRVLFTGNEATLFYCQGGRLYRARSAFADPGQPLAGSTRLLLENVSRCAFRYQAGNEHRSGLVHLALEVRSQGEAVAFEQEIHVRNVP